MCVERKSSGTSPSRTKSRKSVTQPAAAVDGPPTSRRSSTDLIARAADSYSRKYSSCVPAQNTSRFGSFQTSKPQRATSSTP